MIHFFRLTATHLALLRAMYVDWNGCEAGAPTIDPKRPYGNDDHLWDIARLLGWPIDPDSYEPLSPEQVALAGKLHRETETALQIVLCTGSFVPGDYHITRAYDATSWTKSD